jgi:hypothetical protein
MTEAVPAERAVPARRDRSRLPGDTRPSRGDPSPDRAVKAPDERADAPGVESLVGIRVPSPASLRADRRAWHHYLHRVSMIGANDTNGFPTRVSQPFAPNTTTA